MENSPWMDPRFLIVVIPLAVGVIAGYVRLEFRANATAARQVEYETEMDAKVRDLKEEHREVKKAFYLHSSDTKVHHNEAQFLEFRTGLDRQLNGFDTKLNDIVRKLERIAGKQV